MPVINRRQQSLDLRQVANGRISSDSLDSKKGHLWIVDADFEKPQKEMDFPSAKLKSLPPRQKSRNNLRITTIPQVELQDRYLSSEEEASPSPDDYTDNQDDALDQTTFDKAESEDSESSSTIISYPAIATAVPILSVGRPRLIDITNIAPMQRRRRPLHKSHLNAGQKRLTALDENMEYSTSETTEIVASPMRPAIPKRKESLPVPQPASWLPEEDVVPSEDEDDDHYFPDLGVDLRPTPSYADYDPYCLDPPRLVASPTYGPHSPTTRARGGSGTYLTGHNVSTTYLKTALPRRFSLVKRSNGLVAEERPRSRENGNGNKKQKMVARAANDRGDLPIIPPFPFERSKAVMA
ncbi:hypothetical protein MMC24_006488 [Lignoscripta atroalba]|nr:hypothetical protein [Lignoscripta atroalba]